MFVLHVLLIFFRTLTDSISKLAKTVNADGLDNEMNENYNFNGDVPPNLHTKSSNLPEFSEKTHVFPEVIINHVTSIPIQKSSSQSLQLPVILKASDDKMNLVIGIYLDIS